MDTKATGPVEISYQNIYDLTLPRIVKWICYENGHQLLLIWDMAGYFVLVKHGSKFDSKKTEDGIEIYQYMVLYGLGVTHFVCEFYFNVLHDLLRSSVDPASFPDSAPLIINTEQPSWIAFFIRSWLSDLAPNLNPGWQSIPSWEEIERGEIPCVE